MSSQTHKVVKIYTTSTTDSSSAPDSACGQNTDTVTRQEYHSFDELPPETKKYIDQMFGEDGRKKMDNVSIVREEHRQTSQSQPEVKVVNMTHRKVFEESNKPIPIISERKQSQTFTTTSQQTPQQDSNTCTKSEETKTFGKDMLDQLPDECKKYVDDLLKQEGMDGKTIEHVTVHTTNEKTTSSQTGNQSNSEMPELQVKTCMQANDKILVEIDAAGFSPADITMKAAGRNLIIQGKKEGPDPNEPNTTVRRELKRDIAMPPGVDIANITSSLNTATGKLSITIPFPQSAEGVEYKIPVHTNQ